MINVAIAMKSTIRFFIWRQQEAEPGQAGTSSLVLVVVTSEEAARKSGPDNVINIYGWMTYPEYSQDGTVGVGQG